MNVLKQIKIRHPLYTATLDNSIIINVYGNYAIGSDGNKYYHVGKEDDDGVLYTVGWCNEIEQAIIIE